MAKPEAEIYQAAAKGLGLPASETLFVDDRADNCEGGRKAGLQVIQYREHDAFVQEMVDRGLEELWRTGKTA